MLLFSKRTHCYNSERFAMKQKLFNITCAVVVGLMYSYIGYYMLVALIG